MEKENLLTFFTKDPNWKNCFTIVSILLIIINITNMIINPQGQSMNVKVEPTGTNIILWTLSLISSILLLGYNILNTNSLANNPDIKLATFKNIGKLFKLGFEFILGILVYTIAGGVLIMFTIPMFSKHPSGIIINILFSALIALCILFFGLYAYLSYANKLTFRSIFAYSDFRKYKLGKYVLTSIITSIVIFSTIIVSSILIHDESVFNYFIGIIAGLIQAWSCFILAKVAAETIQNVSGSNSGNTPNTVKTIDKRNSIPQINFPKN